MHRDPLGIQPRPLTGQRNPLIADLRLSERIGLAKRLMAGIWVDYPPQLANIYHVMAYRTSTLANWGS